MPQPCFCAPPMVAPGLPPAGATSPRSWEPTWHRRTRSQRAHDCAVAHLYQSLHRLRSHHGSASPDAPRPKARSNGNRNGRNEAASACYVVSGTARSGRHAWDRPRSTACRQCGHNIPNKYLSKDRVQWKP